MDRRVEPELLDLLPANDPCAVKSRKDLTVINAWMGNARIMARALRTALAEQPPRRIAEIGAGDGRYAWSVVRRLAHDWQPAHFILVDRINAVRPETLGAFERLGWVAKPIVSDALIWLGDPAAPVCDAIVANLFLHHFPEAQLSELFRQLTRKAGVFIAVEPRRTEQCYRFSRWLWLLGCNRVTRHDAPVSVRAGFMGAELTRLWPGDDSWLIQEGCAGLGSHLLVARRKP